MRRERECRAVPSRPLFRPARSLRFASRHVERLQIDRVESLADAEQENTDDEECDEYGKAHADLHDEWHAAGTGRGEHQTVLERHESDLSLIHISEPTRLGMISYA